MKCAYKKFVSLSLFKQHFDHFLYLVWQICDWEPSCMPGAQQIDNIQKHHQCRYRNQIIKFWLKKDEFKNGQWFHNKMFKFHLTFWAFWPKLFECLQVKVWSPTHPTIIQYLPIFKIFETLWLFTVVVWVWADLILRNNLNLCKMRLDFRPQTQPSRGPNGLKFWSKTFLCSRIS